MCNCGQTADEKRWATVVLACELLRLSGVPIRVGSTYPETVFLGARWIGLPKPIVWTWPVLRLFVCRRLGLTADSSPARIENAGCGCIAVLRRAVDAGRYKTVKILKRLKPVDWLIVCAALAFGAMIWQMGGCAVGTSLNDNTPMVGLRLGDGDGDALREGAANVGGLIGGLVGGPGGATVGTGIGAVVGGLGAALLGWRSKRKEDAAFDEGVARGAGVPVAAALPVAPAPAKGATA